MSLRAPVVCLLWAVILTASYAFPQTDESNPSPPAPSPPAPTPSASSPPAPSAESIEEAKKQALAATVAANNVESAVGDARELRVRVERYLSEITRITGSAPKPSSSPVDDLRSIDAAVAAIQAPTPDLIERLDKEKEAIRTAEATRDTACDLEEIKGVTPEVSVAQGKCSSAQTHASEETSKLETASTGIRKALGDLYPYAAKQFSALAERLGPLQKLQPDGASPAAEPLLQSLPRNLPVLRQVVTEGGEYQIRWERTKLLLEKLKITPPEGSASADEANHALQTAVNDIAPKLEDWFQVLGKYAQTSASELDGMISKVETDPARNSFEALGASGNKSEVAAELQSIVDAWPPMVAYLADDKSANFNLEAAKKKSTQKAFDVLQSSLNALRGATSRLNDAVAGDFSQFETDQVSLYYFTDVKRLMYALNPAVREMGGVAEAQAQAAAQRKKLTETEFELADAQASVNRYQKQVLDLQEQQRQIQSKLKGQDSKVSQLASRLKHAQREKGKAASDYTDAQNAADDPSKVANVAKAKAKDDAAAAKLSDTQSDYDSAKSDRDATQSQLDAAKSDSNGLPAKIDEAKQALSSAQAAVSEQRRKMLMAAEAESDAFAFARDNAPFLYAPALGSSTDPAKRVVLYAFNDNKTIFMRGKPDDLTLVKDIISKFDRPAPQARLTLWTFQLNADSNQKTNKKAAEQLNLSMEIIDQELADTRALENTTLNLLREVINQQVRHYGECARDGTCSSTLNCSSHLGADREKCYRLNFYDPTILNQIDFDPADLSHLRQLVPDPAGTTTLGEALLILSLARTETKVQVRQNFECGIGTRLANLSLTSTSWPPKKGVPKSFLPLTWQGLGIWDGSSSACAALPACPVSQTPGGRGALSSSQLEIIRALRTAYDVAQTDRIFFDLERVYRRLPQELTELKKVESQLDQLRREMDVLVQRGKANLVPNDRDRLSTLERKAQPLDHEEQRDKSRLTLEAVRLLGADLLNDYLGKNRKTVELDAQKQSIQQKSVPEIQKLIRFGVDPSEIAGGETEITKENMLKLRLAVLKKTGLNSASPRQAAADEMLKEMIIAIEDDLDRLFVHPMITRLRERLTMSGARVGILQRESLLATNRGVARVDPRASASLAVGEEQDILSGVQQLAQLYAKVQSGGALAAFGALQQHPREPQPEIYALTTGNRFQVTPVFDPSGQALRFKFDFVSSSNLQEPNGTTNPQMPRIERHTVNTEVQLSNLETREISRFESNARLGLPTTYWGGVPVLKDIPYVRPWVPLVGWFVRKAGSNAVAQQSVIFGQTTIYPTIGALVDLLADPGLGDPYSQRESTIGVPLTPVPASAAAGSTAAPTAPSAPVTSPPPPAVPPEKPKGDNP